MRKAVKELTDYKEFHIRPLREVIHEYFRLEELLDRNKEHKVFTMNEEKYNKIAEATERYYKIKAYLKTVWCKKWRRVK